MNLALDWSNALFNYPTYLECSSVGKEYACNAGDPGFDSWVEKIPCRRERLPTPIFSGFPGGSVGKEYAYNVGDLGSTPGSMATHSSVLAWRIPLGKGAWWATVHGVAKSRTWPSK